MWRLGRAIERADMTTRVLGVRAAAVLSLAAEPATAPTAWRATTRCSGWACCARSGPCRCTSGPCAARSRVRRSCGSSSSTTASRAPCGRCCARSAGRSPSCPTRRAARCRRRTSRRCCASRRRRAPTAPRSTRRWTPCRWPSPSSTGGSPSATCGSSWRRGMPRRERRRRSCSSGSSTTAIARSSRRQAEADRVIAASLRRPPRPRAAPGPGGRSTDRRGGSTRCRSCSTATCSTGSPAAVAERVAAPGGAARRPVRAAAGRARGLGAGGGAGVERRATGWPRSAPRRRRAG